MSLYEIDGAATRARLDIIAGGGLRALGECARRSGEVDEQVREMRSRHEGWKKAMDDLVKTDRSTSRPAVGPSTLAQGAEALREDKPTTRPTPPPAPPRSTNPPARLADTSPPARTGRPSTRGRAEETGQSGSLPGFGPRMRSRVDRLRQAEAMRRAAQPGPTAAKQPDGTGRATTSGPTARPNTEPTSGPTSGSTAKPTAEPTSRRRAGPAAGRVTTGRTPGPAAGRTTAGPTSSGPTSSGPAAGADDQTGKGKPSRTLKLGAPEDREAEPKSSTPLPRRIPGKAAMPRPRKTADGDEDLSGRTWLR